MRKLVISLLLIALVFSLAGCAGLAAKENQEEAAANATPAPSPTPDLSDILAASATTAQASKSRTPPASPSDVQVDQAAYDKAVQCVGLSVQDLYNAIGQPAEEPTYGPSCLQSDAEDGMLNYPGFSVWTVRTATEEIVHEVYLNN